MLEDFFLDKQYDTLELLAFVEVAETGSFSKAAEMLYVSSTAVLKQMNRLEESVGVKLLDRSHRGVTLTDTGKTFYRNVDVILTALQDAVAQARRSMRDDPYIIRVGDSMLNPSRELIRLWNKLGGNFPQFSLRVVPFESNPQHRARAYRSIGKDFDVMIGHYEEGLWADSYQAIEIMRIPFCLAMSNSNPLVGKDRLELSDLQYQHVMILDEGISQVHDQIRHYLTETVPHVHIESAGTFLCLENFNTCAESDVLLLSVPTWKEVHPALKFAAVDWTFTSPYGVIYPIEPNEVTAMFIEVIRTLLFVRYGQEETPGTVLD